jgi:hypothetical protein
MPWTFEPSLEEKEPDVPFLEDARAKIAPYYSSRKNLAQAIDAVHREIEGLGGARLVVQPGIFHIEKLKRYGFRITYFLHGQPGIIMVAALPIRRETAKRIQQAKVQALLNVADWLKAARTSDVFLPGNNPLLGNLLVQGSDDVTLNQQALRYLAGDLQHKLPAGPDETFEIYE